MSWHDNSIVDNLKAFVFLREFVLGNNSTGLVVNGTDGNVTVVGGEDSIYQNDYIPGTNVIFYGSGTTVSSVVAPSASVSAFYSFLQTATPSPSSNTSNMTSDAVSVTACLNCFNCRQSLAFLGVFASIVIGWNLWDVDLEIRGDLFCEVWIDAVSGAIQPFHALHVWFMIHVHVTL